MTVTDRRTVCIDGTPLLTATQTDEDYDNSPENAYLAAGALARAFHDYDTAADWGLALTRGGVLMRGDARINAALLPLVEKAKAGAQLIALVGDAYAGEAASGVREKLRSAEQARAAEREAERAAVESADAKAMDKIRENSDAYSDYGDGTRALMLMARVFGAAHDDKPALSYVIRARAYAVLGDAGRAHADADRGVADAPTDVLTWVNRADVRRMLGERDGALADALKAIEVDAKSPYGYLIAAEIYDEIGNGDAAEDYYKKLYAVEPKAVARIPDSYLEKIDARAYKERKKAEKKAREAEEEQKKESGM